MVRYSIDEKTGKEIIPKEEKEEAGNRPKEKTLVESEAEKEKAEKERLKINQENFESQVKVEASSKEPVEEKAKEEVKAKSKKK